MNANTKEDVKSRIVELIKTRLELMGTSQAVFAERVSATSAQMSLFLRGKGTLSTYSLVKSLVMVGVNLSMYSERTKLAKEVADCLLSKNVSSIDNWTKKDLATFTQKETILLLFDVQSDNEYVELIKSGIIDIESTYPYFKAIVSYYLSLNNKVKPTASEAQQALLKMRTPHFGPWGIVAGAIAGIYTLASPTKEESNTNSENKQLGALSLFAKIIKPDMFSLLAKAIEYIKNKE